MLGFWITSTVDYTSATECEAIAIHIRPCAESSVEARDTVCSLFGCAYSSTGNAAKQNKAQVAMSFECAHAVNAGGTLWHPVHGVITVSSYSVADPVPPCALCGADVDAAGNCCC